MVSALMALIAFALYAQISGGTRVFRAVRAESPQEDIVIFLERFSSEVRSAFVYAGVPLEGDREHFSAPSLLGEARIGACVYRYNRDLRALERAQLDYSALYRRAEPSVTHRLGGISACSFWYYLQDPKTREFEWVEEIPQGRIPLAVRVSFEYVQDEAARIIVKTADIMAAPQTPEGG